MNLKEIILEELNLLLRNKNCEQIIYKGDPVSYLFWRINEDAKVSDPGFIKFKDFFYALTELFAETDKSDPIFYALNRIIKTADPRDFMSYRKKDVDYQSLDSITMN